MTKNKEIEKAVADLKNISEIIDEIIESLSRGKTAEEKKPEKPLTLEEVRPKLAEKSREGHTAKIRELLIKHGAEKLSEVDPKEYAELLKEVEEL